MLDSLDASLPTGFRHQVALSSGSAFGAPGSGPWGTNEGDGDDAIVGDFDGDAKSDMLIYWPSAQSTTGYRYDVALSTGADLRAGSNWGASWGATQRRRAGDFNGDGRDDLLLDYPDPASPVGFRHVVLLSTGAAFGAAGSGPWAPYAGDGADVVVGDYNGDGKTDMLIYWQDTASSYRYDVYLSTGTDFVYAANWAPGAGASTRRVVGDFNGDGRDDLMVDDPDASLPTGFRHRWTNPTGIELAFNGFLVNGGPWGVWTHNRCSVQSVQPATGFGAPFSGDWAPGVGDGIDVVAGDFTGDRKSDMLVYWQSAPGAVDYDVFPSAGAVFTAAGNWLPQAGATQRRRVGDFNGDGRDDLLIDYPDPASPVGFRHAVELAKVELAKDEKPGFGAPGSGYWAQNAGDGIDVSVGDFNGDRKSDLLIYWQDTSTTYRYDVYLSNGADFVFAANWVPGAGASKRRVIGDFNGDGRDDLMLDYPDASLPTGFRHQVLLSTGASFGGPGSGAWLQGAGDGVDVLSGDFNGDHKSDVLIYWQSGASTYRYDVSLSNGADFVYSGGWLAFGASKRRLAGDYDGDGIDDLMVDALDGANVLHHRVFLSDGGQGTNITLKGCRFRQYGLPAFVDNAMAWLDSPGEWYHDDASGYLYYIPRPGETMASAEVIAPRLEKLVEATGAHHLEFNGLTFAYATWLGPNGDDGVVNLQADSLIKADGTSADIQGNVAMHGVYGVTFERDVFEHLGGTGLTFDGTSRYVLVRGNRMFDISGSGVRLGAFQNANPVPAAQDNHFYIADNYVHDVAVEFFGSIGVLSGYTYGTVIAHNEIANLPYSGISLGWGWGAAALTSGNEISYNHVHDVVRTLSDGAAIYTNGVLGTSWSDATRVTGNYVHDQVNDYGLLYHDDGSTWIETSSNVIGAGKQYWIVLKNAHLSIHDNYTSLTAMLNMTGPDKNGLNAVDVTLSNDQTGLHTWPSAAMAVIGAAGLEPAYRDLLP